MLQYLTAAVRDARRAASLTYAHIAVHVVKRDGRVGVSESTIARFEYAKRWPKDPDAFVAAYAVALEIEPIDLWTRALAAWRAEVA